MMFFGQTIGFGYSILTGSLTLTLMVLPLITRNTQEATFGSIPALPAVKRSAADSPTIRPIARITPVMIPGMADGSKMVRMVCHFPAPSPTAPCL